MDTKFHLCQSYLKLIIDWQRGLNCYCMCLTINRNVHLVFNYRSANVKTVTALSLFLKCSSIWYDAILSTINHVILDCHNFFKYWLVYNSLICDNDLIRLSVTCVIFFVSVPTASGRHMHISNRTTYDRHYNDNGEAVKNQVRDLSHKLGAEALRKYYEHASGEGMHQSLCLASSFLIN